VTLSVKSNNCHGRATLQEVTSLKLAARKHRIQRASNWLVPYGVRSKEYELQGPSQRRMVGCAYLDVDPASKSIPIHLSRPNGLNMPPLQFPSKAKRRVPQAFKPKQSPRPNPQSLPFSYYHQLLTIFDQPNLTLPPCHKYWCQLTGTRTKKVGILLFWRSVSKCCCCCCSRGSHYGLVAALHPDKSFDTAQTELHEC
jgi:hypothetical protein